MNCCDFCEHGAASLTYYPERCEWCDGIKRFSPSAPLLAGLVGKKAWYVYQKRVTPCHVGGVVYESRAAYISVKDAEGDLGLINACNMGRLLFTDEAEAVNVAAEYES
jgi:hypothetical protein